MFFEQDLIKQLLYTGFFMWKWVLIFCLATSALNAEINVLAFAGSTRNESTNKKLIHEAANVAHELGAQVTLIDLKDFPMPFYDADLEEAFGMPENAKQLRQLFLQSDVILIASPDYNHSVSGVLKNTLDWVSRNEKAERSREAYQGKKFAIMSASPGKNGGSKGLVHLRDILLDQRAVIMAQQVCVPDAYNAFDESGKLIDPKLKEELLQLIKEVLK